MPNIAFDISSALLIKSNQKSVKPDANGIYHDLPLMVLGKVSRNNKEYEVESMVDALTNNFSPFVRRLKAGQLIGEWGHPMIYEEKDLPRVMLIDQTKESHTIHRVWTGETTEQGHTIVYGDIQCSGPYGTYLKERLENPLKNAAFSLRSLVAKIGQEGNVIKQRVNALVTVDAVDCPGYAEASKVYIPGLEGMQCEFDPREHLSELASAFGCESIHDQQLLDILEVDEVSIAHNINGIIDFQNGAVIDKQGHRHQIFHNVFGR